MYSGAQATEERCSRSLHGIVNQLAFSEPRTHSRAARERAVYAHAQMPKLGATRRDGGCIAHHQLACAFTIAVFWSEVAHTAMPTS